MFAFLVWWKLSVYGSAVLLTYFVENRLAKSLRVVNFKNVSQKKESECVH